jgi:hypothetical protein
MRLVMSRLLGINAGAADGDPGPGQVLVRSAVPRSVQVGRLDECPADPADPDVGSLAIVVELDRGEGPNDRFSLNEAAASELRRLLTAGLDSLHTLRTLGSGPGSN